MEKHLEVQTVEQAANIFGDFDQNMKLLEDRYNVRVIHRGTQLKITGGDEDAEKARRALARLIAVTAGGEQITEQTVRYVMSLVDDGEEDKLRLLGKDCVAITAKGKPIKPKTLGQRTYVEAIRNNVITFGIGPAGTGKTYLAVAMAVTALKNKEVGRLIITRPAVEAGEKLGFLPGDLQNKVDPYLRPLHDALYDMLGVETYQKYVERGVIEVAPLAYMRGRTLDDAYIILDEAQNTTREQMKMFLTRIGFGSRAIVTGDITQIDLPEGKKSGLKEVMRVLKSIGGIVFCMLTEKDVVRHPLVQEIVKAYEKDEQKRAVKRERRP
ncbi:MAG: PhoH family protein [Clostridiales bacterium]|jgi:phosphate starvation-inducible PhoH-like protein|nr:PhoH family protein [Clostridiales bacterium]